MSRGLGSHAQHWRGSACTMLRAVQAPAVSPLPLLCAICRSRWPFVESGEERAAWALGCSAHAAWKPSRGSPLTNTPDGLRVCRCERQCYACQGHCNDDSFCDTSQGFRCLKRTHTQQLSVPGCHGTATPWHPSTCSATRGEVDVACVCITKPRRCSMHKLTKSKFPLFVFVAVQARATPPTSKRAQTATRTGCERRSCR